LASDAILGSTWRGLGSLLSLYIKAWLMNVLSFRTTSGFLFGVLGKFWLFPVPLKPLPPNVLAKTLRSI